MRISTQQIYNIANKGMADAQKAIVKTEQQIATGKRVINPSDDPVAATVILQLRDTIARGEQYQTNIDIAENTLELEGVALESVNSLLQRMRELAVQAGNTAVLSESDYKAIKAEVDARVDELLNLANTRNSAGEYIFAGYQGETKPFESNGNGGFSYHGDEGNLSIKISDSAKVKVSDSGRKIFQDIPSPTNTIHAYVSETNKSSPPIIVSTGQVADQEVFDQFYPEDLVVSFNALSNVSPAANNYSISERSTGKVIVQNQVYQPGNDIEVNGVSFHISGTPYPGEAAVAGTVQWGSDIAQNFAGDETGETLSIRVGGVTETLTIGSNVTNDADVVTELTTGTNASRLANLGVTVNTGTTPPQFEVANGLNVEIDPTNASGGNILAALGINSGTLSSNGIQASPGDTVIIESTKSQGLLTTLSRFSQALSAVEDTPESKKTFAAMVSATLGSLAESELVINATESELGARLNTIESTRNMHFDADLLNREVLSDMEDLDYSEAATRLSLETFILQATQQSFVRVSGLSLFNLL
ncbi:MAG: flagellar hook-associated protein FlgL [Cellvibrionaceae bacterium]